MLQLHSFKGTLLEVPSLEEVTSCLVGRVYFKVHISAQQVQELVNMGSALDFILDYPHAVGLVEFKIWAAQIASGMNYLEEKG